MKNKVNHISLLFVLLTLILLSSDYSFPHNPVKMLTECNGTSGCFDDSQTNCFEEDVFISNSVIKTTPFENQQEFYAELTTDFKDNYSAFVWQPPKFS